MVVTIGAGPNDGVAGERDNVKADVESVQGGRGNDVLTGNGRSNRLYGGGGKDRVLGKGGSDLLVGAGGDDRLDAREGGTATGRAAQAGSVDRVVCGGGNDTPLVGPVDMVDPDAGQQHALALVAGAADNGAFTIAGNQLRTAQNFDFEAESTYSIRVSATDNGSPSMSFEQTLTVSVTDDTTDQPTADPITVDGVVEDDTAATTITLSGNDPEGHALTFAVAEDPAHGTPGAIGAVTCGGSPNVCSADVDYTRSALISTAPTPSPTRSTTATTTRRRPRWRSPSIRLTMRPRPSRRA